MAYHEALYRKEVADCIFAYPLFGAFVLGYAAVAYGIVAAIYFTVRWVIRGYRSPA
jgi:hypothetical protein